MSGLNYVGRNADTDSSLTYKGYVDSRYTAIKVDVNYVNSVTADRTSALVTTAYVDSQDALRANKANVDTADNGYILATQRGVANGVASIGSDGYVVPTQVSPDIKTERLAQMVVGTLTFTGGPIVNSTTITAFKAGTLDITDPGFPYLVHAFVQIQGGTFDGSSSNDGLGTGNYGRIAVLDVNDTSRIFSLGVTTGSSHSDYFMAVPYAPAGATPVSMSPQVGDLSLGLYLSLWSGTGFTFTATQPNFFALIYPAG